MNNAKVAIQNSTENRKINKKQHQNICIYSIPFVRVCYTKKLD